MAGEDIGRPPEGFTQNPKEPISMLSKGVGVPTDLLTKSLELKTGSTVGRLSVVSAEFAQQLAEYTETPEIKDLPVLPMSVKRISEDSWEIKVGKRTYEADRSTMEKVIRGEQDEQDASQPPSRN